jgi:hypothetical protein
VGRKLTVVEVKVVVSNGSRRKEGRAGKGKKRARRRWTLRVE